MSGDDRGMPIGPEQERDTEQVRIPKGLGLQLNTWAKNNNCDKVDFFKQLHKKLPNDPGALSKILAIIDHLNEVDQSPSGSGSSSADMKEICMAKMWAKLAMSDDVVRPNNGSEDKMDKLMDRMMQLELIRSMRPVPPPPPQKSLAEEMMLMDRMNKDPQAAQQMIEAQRQRDEQYRRDLESRDKSTEKMLEAITDKIEAKNQEQEKQEMLARQDEVFARYTQLVNEQFATALSSIERRLGYAGQDPADRTKAFIQSATDIKNQVSVLREIASQFNISPQQSDEAIKKAAEKTGLSKYTSDIKEMFDSLGNAADKIAHVGGTGELPPPPGRVVQQSAGLRPVSFGTDEVQYAPKP